MLQGLVENAGGGKIGVVGNDEEIGGIGGNLYSGYGVMGKMGVSSKGGKSMPGMEGNSGGVCERRRAPTVTSMLEKDSVMKKVKMTKWEVDITFGGKKMFA